MTARTHETIRVGLRKIIRDQSVSPTARMRAIEMLMHVEGLLEVNPHRELPKNTPKIAPETDATDKKLRDLLALAQEQKPK